MKYLRDRERAAEAPEQYHLGGGPNGSVHVSCTACDGEVIVASAGVGLGVLIAAAMRHTAGCDR